MGNPAPKWQLLSKGGMSDRMNFRTQIARKTVWISTHFHHQRGQIWGVG
jgi:hypothetical protein